jgi:tRNA nucleotidyltransferase (CCA-adding enzyme)
VSRMSAPPAVVRILRRLEGAGYEAWIVGGCVRDLLSGRPVGDWDLTTRARPKDVRRLFRRTVPIGVEHGTVGVISTNGVLYEVTTFRRDVETDGRHAVVAFADRLQDDLARRDFTINAIAWHPLRDELYDPYGGRADLDAGVLRAVGTPSRRFAEDHLRVLRALRFAGLFELQIEPSTWAALKQAVPQLRTLSAERIRDELLKVLEADPKPSGVLNAYRESGALEVLYPELAELPGRGLEWSGTLATVDWLPRGRPLQRLAALLRPLRPARAAALLVRLKLSNYQTDETAARAKAPPLPAANAGDLEFRRWLSKVGPQRLPAVSRLELAEARARTSGRDPSELVAAWRRARHVVRTRPPLRLGDLELDGDDLIRLGMRPGPRFGRILSALLEWVLEDPARNRPEILEARALELARAEAGQGGDSR